MPARRTAAAFRPAFAAGTAAVLVCLLALASIAAAADFTPTHRRQLREAQTKLGLAARLIRDGDESAAKDAVSEAEAIVESIRSESGYAADHGVFRSYNRLLADRKESLGETAAPATATGGAETMAAGGVSFSRDVQPILNSRCTRCHGGGRASGGIRLDSYDALARSGRSGPLVTAGLPDRSTLFSRLITDDILRRMPKNGEPVPADEVATIRDWIIEGGKNDASAAPSDMAGGERKLPENVTIPKPTGGETVSFSEEIAPFFVQLCVGCHSGNDPRGGLSLESFHNMMAGGDSGIVVIPGDKTNSRLFRLTGGLELPRMPDSRARLTRTNYENLKTWFDEGCKFDGDDPKAPLASLFKSEAEKRMDAIRALPPEQRIELTKADLTEMAGKAMPSLTLEHVQNGAAFGTIHVFVDGPVDGFVSAGNAAGTQLDQSHELAAVDLRKQGGMGLIAVGKQYTFNEFARHLLDRDIAIGQPWFAWAEGEQVVAVVNTDSRRGPLEAMTDAQLAQAATVAALVRTHGELPRWLSSGIALTEIGIPPQSPLGRSLSEAAAGSIGRVSADQVLSDSHAADAIDAVGYAVVGELTRGFGREKVIELAKAIGGGQPADAAVQSVLRSSPRTLGERLQRAAR